MYCGDAQQMNGAVATREIMRNVKTNLFVRFFGLLFERKEENRAPSLAFLSDGWK